MSENAVLRQRAAASSDKENLPVSTRDLSVACAGGASALSGAQKAYAVRVRGVNRKARVRVRPTVLVVTTAKWFPTARLGIALHRAGFEVEFFGPARHPSTRTRVVAHAYVYEALNPLSSLKKAIQNGEPDLLVSSDDLATYHLHDLYDQQKRAGDSGRSICDLIERSLGCEMGFPVVRSRVALMALAEEEGIRLAMTAVIPDTTTLKKWIGEKGLPVVLKTDGSSSGEGVRVAASLQQAERAFHALRSPVSFVRMAKRALINRDLRWVRPALERRRSVISAQEFISGMDATSLVACWKGEVLAGLHFKVIRKQYVRGPASALRLVENAEIVDAIQKIVRRLRLSGLHGFDFLLKDECETPYLIEMNPRATQVGHLPLGRGCDLPAALYSALTGKPIQEAPRVTDKPTIVLFPQEWPRDQESAYLDSQYHDLPLEEPELMRECLRKTRLTTAGLKALEATACQTSHLSDVIVPR